MSERTLTQRYDSFRISNINKQDMRELIKTKIKELILDFGQKIETTTEQEALYYLVNRSYELISSKYRYWTWGDIDLALERGKIGQYSRNTITSSKVTVQKIQSWLFNFSEERSRQRQHEQKNAAPDPVDRTNKAPAVYAEAMVYKMKHLSQYPQIWNDYSLQRIIKHLEAGIVSELTEQINIQKEQYEPVHSVLSGKSNRKKSYSAAR